MASLHILKGQNAGTRIPLDKPVLTIGREAKDCDLVVPNQAVSRVHAQIIQVNGQYFLEDLKSRNHTFLNNKQIEARQPLRDNDRIKICDTLFTFHSGKEGLPALPEDLRRTQLHDEEPDLPSTVQATLSRVPQQQLLEAQPADRLRALLEISSSLNSAVGQDALLDRIVDVLFQTFRQADRCFIILTDEATGHPVVRNFRHRRPAEDSPKFSKTIVRRCLDKMEAFLIEDAATDGKLSLAQSITDFKIRSVMIAPIGPPEGPAHGAIQLDTLDRGKRFSQDDLKLLTSVAHQASVAIDNSRMHADQARRDRVLRDMEIAEQVQRSFLPRQTPAVPGYEFYAHYKSAMTIGGDYYDFVELPDGKWAILLGDVAGKGVPAALLMAKLSAEARFHILTQPDPTAAFARINDFIIDAGLSDRFVTLAGAILDPVAHIVRLINGGHVTPMLYRAYTEELIDAIASDRTGFPLGVIPATTYEFVDVELAPGDTLLLFTDGVTDALNPQNKQFRLEGVRSAVCLESAVGEVGSSPARTGKRLIDAVRSHIAGRDQYDDIALVSLGRYDGPPSSGSITKVGLSTSDQAPLR
ncbi:MAG: SpoIIE family protein phosphatase [Gemmataceae bacterium]|nr:SpoIIE family protein phosphatase [Gemmataceae bacterium]